MITEPLVGAVIGYFTNWLAIKMIFRPHTEKRILGIKVPFTPGLIPKERYVLSKKVGDVVAKHLLTEEVMIKGLVNDEIHQKLNVVLDRCLEYLRNNDLTLQELTQKLYNSDENLWDKVENMALDYILKELQNEKNSEIVCDILSEQVQKLMKVKVKDMPIEEAKIWLNQMFAKYGKEYIESNDFEKLIKDNIQKWKDNLHNSDKRMGDIISDNVKVNIVHIIQEKTEPVSKGIVNFMENPEADEKIRAAILKFIDENVGKIITLFVSSDKICNGILKAIKDYLLDESNYSNTADKLISFINTFYEMQVGEIFDKVPENYKDYPISDTVIDLVRKFATEENIGQMVASLSGSLNKFEEESVFNIIIKIEPNVEFKLKEFISKQYKKLIEDEKIANVIKDILVSQINKLKNKRINEIISFVPEKVTDGLKENILNIYDKMITKTMIDILKAMNVSKIVEDRINEFDMDFAEDILLGVIDKELKAITWLGGLLGFLIGLVTVAI